MSLYDALREAEEAILNKKSEHLEGATANVVHVDQDAATNTHKVEELQTSGFQQALHSVNKTFSLNGQSVLLMVSGVAVYFWYGDRNNDSAMKLVGALLTLGGVLSSTVAAASSSEE